MSDQVDALESLVAHPGWMQLAEKARAEWAVREFTARRNALADTDDKRALDKLRQITAAQEAVEWVLTWPSEEVAKRKRQELAPAGPVSMSRRGTL